MSNLMASLKKRKLFLAVSLLVLLLLGAFFVWRKNREASLKKGSISTAEVKRTGIAEVVAANGRVVPNFEVEIKAKASGKIISLPFDISDRVKEGDLLVQLDPIDESRQVAQAQASLAALENKLEQAKLNSRISQLNLKTELEKAKANLAAAKTKYQEAEAKFARQKKLYEGDFISKEEFEVGTSELAQAKTNLENSNVRFNELKTQELDLKVKQEEVAASRANLQSSKVGLLNAEQRLSETKIFSPIAGVVTSRPAQIGLIVSSGINNVGGGTTLMTVADLSEIFTIASVDESDIGRVKLGQKVKITADAYPNEPFFGEVVQIASKGLNEANVVTFDVKIRLLGEAKYKLKPEMTTNLEIIIRESQQALLVPNEAIRKKNGETYVLVLTSPKQKPEKRPVQSGISDGNNTEILSGLQEAEKVVLQKRQADRSRWRKEKPGGLANAPRGMMAGRH